MLHSRKIRRGLVALSLAVHLAAGLLATAAHDHGGCCGRGPQAAGTAAPDRPQAGAAVSGACRHGHCHHAAGDRGTQPPGPGSRAARDTAPAAPHEPVLTAGCLACDFLAGALAILPWTPVICSSPARWREVCCLHSAERLAPAMAFLARGPPAAAGSAFATASIGTHTHSHRNTIP